VNPVTPASAPQTPLQHMTSEIRFMLYVNAQPNSAHLTLEAAQERAREFVASRRALKILGYFHVAPSKTWTYDYEIDAWVEQL